MEKSTLISVDFLFNKGGIRLTQVENALQGVITPEMEQVAGQEGISADFVRRGVGGGTIVIPCNKKRCNVSAVGIGAGLRTKVSASIGLYGEQADVVTEVEKIRVAVAAGTLIRLWT